MLTCLCSKCPLHKNSYIKCISLNIRTERVWRYLRPWNVKILTTDNTDQKILRHYQWLLFYVSLVYKYTEEAELETQMTLTALEHTYLYQDVYICNDSESNSYWTLSKVYHLYDWQVISTYLLRALQPRQEWSLTFKPLWNCKAVVTFDGKITRNTVKLGRCTWQCCTYHCWHWQ